MRRQTSSLPICRADHKYFFIGILNSPLKLLTSHERLLRLLKLVVLNSLFGIKGFKLLDCRDELARGQLGSVLRVLHEQLYDLLPCECFVEQSRVFQKQSEMLQGKAERLMLVEKDILCPYELLLRVQFEYFHQLFLYAHLLYTFFRVTRAGFALKDAQLMLQRINRVKDSLAMLRYDSLIQHELIGDNACLEVVHEIPVSKFISKILLIFFKFPEKKFIGDEVRLLPFELLGLACQFSQILIAHLHPLDPLLTEFLLNKNLSLHLSNLVVRHQTNYLVQRKLLGTAVCSSQRTLL